MSFAALVVSTVALLISLAAVWYTSRAIHAITRSGVPSASVYHGEAAFRLQYVSRHRYVLHNDGTAAAQDVRVDPGELVVHEGETAFDAFPPGRSEEYLLIQPLGGRVTELVVAWREEGSETPRIASLPLGSPATYDDEPAG